MQQFYIQFMDHNDSTCWRDLAETDVQPLIVQQYAKCGNISHILERQNHAEKVA